MLKLIAILTMIIDHTGLLLLNDNTICRIIGRISLPIFSYLIYKGYNRTRNLNKYKLNILIFAVITQVIYEIFDKKQINILFVYLFAILLLDLRKNWGIKSYLVLLLVLAFASNIEYGIYPIIIIILFNNHLIQQGLLYNGIF
jgi:hypothetical protein